MLAHGLLKIIRYFNCAIFWEPQSTKLNSRQTFQLYGSPHRGLNKIGQGQHPHMVKSQAPVYTNPLDLAAPFSLMSLFKVTLVSATQATFYHCI